MDEFEDLKALGRGAFATVRLVRKKADGDYYGAFVCYGCPACDTLHGWHNKCMVLACARRLCAS